ncbi:MAG: aspartate aminotransferase family protein [Limisphaerales bacterium]
MNTKTKNVLQLLRDYESPNITFMEEDGSWPIVWDRALGVHVWDAEGKKYLDLTAAFGVAAAGHANLRVVKAGQEQMARLLHAMGDVHPHPLKAQLACELSRITFERWTRNNKPTTSKTIFCNSGFEAVEAAFKTAVLATGRPGVIAFSGAYHGLGYGALNATHRDHFRTSFRTQLRRFTHFAPFPKNASDLSETESVIRHFFRKTKIGGILVEPIQARGGINVPPPEFLPLLRKICDENGAVLIFDEIYTGFGRTGKWFACEHSGVVPDLICLGKAMSGGFPISACVGRAEVMDTAWPRSHGEAIHTSTFLGHPVGCAMALTQISEIRRLKLVEKSAANGGKFIKLLKEKVATLSADKLKCSVRGVGLMSGVVLCTPDGKPDTATSLRAIKELLHEGYILLPEGENAEVISFTPPLTITERQLMQTGEAVFAKLQSL